MGFIDPSEIDSTDSSSSVDPDLAAWAATLPPDKPASTGRFISPSEIDAPVSDLGAITSAATRGLGGSLNILDELLPGFSPKADNALKIVPPHLFGLFGTERPAASFTQDYESGAKALGLLNNAKPATEIGDLTANIAENAFGATPFGGPAMLATGLFGGFGGYLGEKAGEAAGYPTGGKLLGSALGGLTPGAIGKLGIVEELSNQLGPVASQIPGLNKILGNTPIEAAVGRALEKTSTNPSLLEDALLQQNSFVGPKTQADALKTVDELTGDVGIARATDATENAVSNAGFKQIGEQRNAVNEAALTQGYDPKLTSYDVSKAAEQKIINSDETLRAVENATWSELPKGDLVDTRGASNQLDSALENKLSDITSEGALPLEGEGKALVSQFRTAQNATDEGVVNLGVIQKLREKALKLGRDTASRLTPQDRQANDVASAIEEHLRNIVDHNAEAGNLAEGTAQLWKGARTLTRERIQTFAAPKPGLENQGTKALENLAIKKLEPIDDKLLKEGMNSPDALAAQIRAGLKGGQDIRPQYRQALQAELDGAPPSKWASIIERKRQQWELTHTPEEMTKIDASLKNVEEQLRNNANRMSTGSQTTPRQNIKEALFSEKGIARLGSGSELANLITGGTTLASTYEGAKKGWESGQTPAGKVFRALLGGATGAVIGKTFKGAASRASTGFDNLLIEALKDPLTAAKVLKAAKPSQFGSQLSAVGLKASQIAGANAGGQILKHVINNAVKQSPVTPQKQTQTSIDSALNRGEAKLKESDKTPAIKAVEKKIDADPIDSAIYETESNRDPEAKNPNSSASGAFQLTKGTAKALGVKDVFDIADNYQGYQKLRAENEARFGSDPAVLYAAHYLGAPVLEKVMKGEDLTKQESEQVAYLKAKALPRFERIYKSKVTNA